MTPAELEKLRELAMEATSGPWKSINDKNFLGTADFPGAVILDYGVGPCAPNVVASRITESDAAYIAAANPAVVLSLLREIKVLNRALEVASGWGTADDSSEIPRWIDWAEAQVAKEEG